MRFFKWIFILQLFILLVSACERPETPTPVQWGKPMYYRSSAVVTTYTGRRSIGNPGNKDGNLTTASYGNLAGLAFDSKKNLFVADRMFHTIRKISPSGEVSTFAGSGKRGSTNGSGIHASFNEPYGIVADPEDNLYIADSQNNCIRKITPAGEVTTFAGSIDGTRGAVNGTGTAARFYSLLNLALDQEGNLFATDAHKIRKITPAGQVTTLAGGENNGSVDGPGASASFWSPAGIAVGQDGNIYVTDYGRIRKITPDGFVTTFAGSPNSDIVDGVGTAAVFRSPGAMTVDASGNLYLTDLFVIRKVTPDSVVTTIAGGSGSPYRQDGIGCTSSFTYPTGISIDADGNLYTTEESMIRKITLK